MANQFLNVPVPAANGSGAAVDFSSFGASKTIVVAGSWTLPPTINIEFNNSNSSSDGTWQSIATFQGAGKLVLDIACKWIRATVSNFRGGQAADCNIGGTSEGTDLANLPTTTGNGDGTPVDVSTMGVFKTVQVGDAFRGTTIIEISVDGGTTWAQIMSFGQPGAQSASFSADYMRVVRSGVPVVNPGQPVVNIGATDMGSGGGGGVDLEENGTPVAGGPFDTLNFINATVTDQGAGLADITVQDSGNSQRFIYTATGAEGSDFMVTLPVARANDTYLVTGACQGVSMIVGFDFPDTLAGDKTTTQFRVISTASLTLGDEIYFNVADPT